MNDSSSPPRWAPIVARASGVWILVGCLLKAFLGTPADLPSVIRRLPLSLGTTFSLVLAIEAFVGLMMLLRPGRAWPAEILLLVAFAVVLATQLVAGVSSCGCFGATIPVPPWAMLVVDVLFLGGLLWSTPWRLPHGGTKDLLAGAAALVFAVLLPLIVNRETKIESVRPATSSDPTASPGAAPAANQGTGLRRWVELGLESWSGKALRETSLAKAVTLPESTDGVWIFYRESCDVCAECLQMMSILERGARDVTLVRIPEKPGSSEKVAVHALPMGAHVRRIDLPAGVDWIVTAPARMIVEGGVVTEAREGVGGQDCR